MWNKAIYFYYACVEKQIYEQVSGCASANFHLQYYRNVHS